MTASVLNLAFGQGGSVLGPTVANDFGGTAVTAQPDGKIVAVEFFTSQDTSAGDAPLSVRRYNADGSLDTSFGTAGQFDLPLPTGQLGFADPSHNVVEEPDGAIVLAADVDHQGPDGTSLGISDGGVVYRLTPDGRTDPAIELPRLADFAIRPSAGGVDVVESFGIPGPGVTVPAASIVSAQPSGALDLTVADDPPTIRPKHHQARVHAS